MKKFVSWFKCLTVILIACAASGCVTCMSFVGPGKCAHNDWIPSHYEGNCFVPGHYMCFRGTQHCIGCWKDGFWRSCGYWISGRYTCDQGQYWYWCNQYRCGGHQYWPHRCLGGSPWYPHPNLFRPR